jgi:hypothetical protein
MSQSEHQPLPFFKAIKIAFALAAAFVDIGLGNILADGRMTRNEREEAIRALFIDPDGAGPRSMPLETIIKAILDSV